MIRIVIPLLAVVVSATSLGAQAHGGSRHHGPAGHDDTEDVRAILRSVAVNQMRHHVQHGRYASSLRELGLAEARAITVRITASGGQGFSAVSVSATEECAFYSGRVTSPRAYVRRPNEVICRPLPAP